MLFIAVDHDLSRFVGVYPWGDAVCAVTSAMCTVHDMVCSTNLHDVAMGWHGVHGAYGVWWGVGAMSEA